MNILRLWAVMRKEFMHIVRDPRSLGMGIAIPMLLLILFGYALTLDVDDGAHPSNTHCAIPGLRIRSNYRCHAHPHRDF